LTNPTHSLKIITIQSEVGANEEKVYVSAKGTVKGNKDDYTIIYTEDGTDGETTLRVTDSNKISVIRKGEIDSFIIIEKNVRHQSRYMTSEGFSFTMTTTCKYIHSDFENGLLSFKYSNDMNMIPAIEISFDFIFSLI